MPVSLLSDGFDSAMRRRGSDETPIVDLVSVCRTLGSATVTLGIKTRPNNDALTFDRVFSCC